MARTSSAPSRVASFQREPGNRVDGGVVLPWKPHPRFEPPRSLRETQATDLSAADVTAAAGQWSGPRNSHAAARVSRSASTLGETRCEQALHRPRLKEVAREAIVIRKGPM